MKSRGLQIAENEAKMGDTRNTNIILVENASSKISLGRQEETRE
jgi:hypothetical protein